MPRKDGRERLFLFGFKRRLLRASQGRDVNNETLRLLRASQGLEKQRYFKIHELKKGCKNALTSHLLPKKRDKLPMGAVSFFMVDSALKIFDNKNFN